MKKFLSIILFVATICVQPIKAIIPESYLRYYLEDETKFWRVRTCTSQDNQEEQLRQDRKGTIVGQNEMILVIKMANPNNGKIYAPHDDIKAFKDEIKAVFVWFDAGLQRSHAVQIESNAFKNYTALESFYSYIDTLSYDQGAFEGCRQLERIETYTGLPYCKKLGAYAFKDCRSLKSIDFSRSESLIFEWEVFSGCTALDTVVFPATAKVRGTGARDLFNGCQSLRSVIIPDTISSLLHVDKDAVKNMYAGCSSLEEVKVPYDVKYISEGFVKGCTSLKKLTVPNTVEYYDSAMLNDCKTLDTLCFAAKTLQAHTFDSCPNLHVLTLQNGVDSIADFAFSGLRNIQTLQLPRTLRAITGGAFLGSTGIDTVWCYNNNYRVHSDGALYKGLLNELVYMPQAQTPSRLTLHNLTKHIGPYAFCNNSHLDTVMLHYDVESIGDSAFAGCTNVKKLYLPNMHLTAYKRCNGRISTTLMVGATTTSFGL